MPDIQIQNVVASTTIGDELDLDSISEKFENAEYEPEQFPGLVFRVKEPKTAALIFRSGKVVVTGAKSIGNVGIAIAIVCDALKSQGFNGIIDNPQITVQNIVSTSDLGAELNLNAVAIGLGLENIEYEPEQFPGLIYRLTEPKVVVLIFGSGKLVVTGAKSTDDASTAVDKILAELQSLGLLG